MMPLQYPRSPNDTGACVGRFVGFGIVLVVVGGGVGSGVGGGVGGGVGVGVGGGVLVGTTGSFGSHNPQKNGHFSRAASPTIKL